MKVESTDVLTLLFIFKHTAGAFPRMASAFGPPSAEVLASVG